MRPGRARKKKEEEFQGAEYVTAVAHVITGRCSPVGSTTPRNGWQQPLATGRCQLPCSPYLAMARTVVPITGGRQFPDFLL